MASVDRPTRPPAVLKHHTCKQFRTNPHTCRRSLLIRCLGSWGNNKLLFYVRLYFLPHMPPLPAPMMEYIAIPRSFGESSRHSSRITLAASTGILSENQSWTYGVALRPLGQHAHLILPFSCLDSELGPHPQPRPTVCCQRPLHRCRRGAPSFCRPATGCSFEGGTSSSSARAFPRILDAAQNIMRQRGQLSLRKYMAQLRYNSTATGLCPGPTDLRCYVLGASSGGYSTSRNPSVGACRATCCASGTIRLWFRVSIIAATWPLTLCARPLVDLVFRGPCIYLLVFKRLFLLVALTQPSRFIPNLAAQLLRG